MILQGNYNILTKTAVFQLKSHKTTSQWPLPELIWERYHNKTTQPFFRSCCEWHLTLWNFFLDVRFWMFFDREATKICTEILHCQNSLPGKHITLKTTSLSSKILVKHLTFIWKSKFLCQKVYKLAYSSQVTCALLQFSVNR